MRAQDLQSLGGKILRVTRDGAPAPGNPFPSAPLVYSYGHRNVQGLAWDATGQLYNTEHGPTGDCGYGGSNDEVNIIFAGANYGWPICVGICADPRFVDPVKLFFPDTAAPSGATFLRSNLVPQWTGSLFFGTMGFPGNDFARHLHRIVFDVDGRTVLFEEPLFSSLFGRIRDAVEGPDGFIYFSNSNRDGRGGDVLGPDDDRVVRIRPAPPP
jgi:glucose/arabinose dehydrogenase